MHNVTLHKVVIISCLFFACATGEQIAATKAPPAPTSPPVTRDEAPRYAQAPADDEQAPAERLQPSALNNRNDGRAGVGGAPAAIDLGANAKGKYDPPAHATAEPAAVAPAADNEARLADKAAEPERRAKSESAAGAPSASALAAGVPSASRPPPPLDRPGLATSWGETRYAPVDQVAFERDSAQPNCQGSLWYNDRSGAQAAGRNTAWSSARLPIGCAVSIEIHDENGTTLSAVRSGGRVYAIGESNQRYTITVHNNSNARYEMVVSVDGLDVIDGRTAGFGKRGYLVPARGSVDIEGFRRSGSEVAAFRFGAVSDSYAARTTGSARNVGVIGLAAFAERGSIPAYSYRELEQRRSAEPFPNHYAPAPPVANYNTLVTE